MTLTISITHADEAFPEDLILEVRDEPLTMSYNIRLELNRRKLNELYDFIESFEQGVSGRYIINGNPPHFPYQVLEFWTNELLLEATSNDNLATGYTLHLGNEPVAREFLRQLVIAFERSLELQASQEQ